MRLTKYAVLLAVSLLIGCQKIESPEQKTTTSSTGQITEGAPTSVPGPVAGTRITEGYARMLARETYFWAWPMVNIYNRRLAFSHAPSPGIMNDLPFAPLISANIDDLIYPETISEVGHLHDGWILVECQNTGAIDDLLVWASDPTLGWLNVVGEHRQTIDEESVKTQLDQYAKFIDSTPSYVITEALKVLFKR